jgi:Fe-S-cluster containining protein
MSPKQTKTAAKKPKGEHPSTTRDQNLPLKETTWSGKRLPATFEWDFPARLLPTRRDQVSERWSDRMDIALVDAIRASYAQPGPGAPTEPMLHAQREYHDAYGQFLSHNIAANSIKVSCGRGCSRCCHHFVTSVHALEVLSFYENIRKRDDMEELIQSCEKRVADYDAWKEFCEETYPERTPAERDDLALEHYYDERLPCPFLDPEGACGAYPDRPMTCRMYIASSPPEFCEAENVTDDRADVFTIPADESIAARLERLDRAVDYWGHSPDLYRSLVKLHEWRRRWTPGV